MGIFFSLFTDYNYRISYSLIVIEFPEKINQQVMLIYSFFMLTTHYSYCYYSRSFFSFKNSSVIEQKFKKEEATDYTLLKIGKAVIWIFLVFAFYRVFLEVKLLYGNRLLLFTSGGTANLDIPLIIRIATTLFQTGYLFILAAYPPRKTFILYTSIYMFTILPGIIIGNRMLLATMLLFVFWYLNKMYVFKLHKTTTLLYFIAFLLIMQVVALFRSGNELTNTIWSLIPLFLISQSTSFYILGLFIENQYQIQYYNYPYILDNVIGGFMGVTGQSLGTLEVRSNLGHQLVYSLNPDYYLNGFSIGTSSIAELYEFGLIGVIIGAIAFVWFIAKFDYMVNRHRLYMIFSVIFFTTIITSLRASFFPYFYDMVKDILFFVLIVIIYNILSKQPVKISCFTQKRTFKIPC
jgi:oligosaccharide repeat unit polymerase